MKIIIATDGTPQSAGLVQAASGLQLPDGSEIIVATVVDMGLPITIDLYSGYLPSASEAESNARVHADKLLSAAEAKVVEAFAGRDVKITKEALFGSPDSRIVELAEERQADLIIIGSHGYNRWERLLLGSVSDSIIHHAPCSVMVVRK